MRLVDIARIAALISCGALLSACPKKDEPTPEPAATTSPVAVPTPVSDKAGAEPAAPAAPAKKKADDDKGGW